MFGDRVEFFFSLCRYVVISVSSLLFETHLNKCVLLYKLKYLCSQGNCVESLVCFNPAVVIDSLFLSTGLGLHFKFH